MAGKKLVPPPSAVKADTLCPHCKDFLKKPVKMECGHSFCQDCLSDYSKKCEEKRSPLVCPICGEPIQEAKLQQNQELASLVEKFKQLPPVPGKQYMCLKHNEKLNLFCVDDEEMICLLCERSPEHESHTVVLPDEVSEKYKIELVKELMLLRAKRDNMAAYTTDAEKEVQVMLKQIEEEREKAVRDFKEIRELMEKEEQALLAQMKELEKDISKAKKEQMLRFSTELLASAGSIREIEKKCQQPPVDLLMDYKSTMQKCSEMLKDPVIFPPALKWKVWELCDLLPFFEGAILHFKYDLDNGHEVRRANITLHPDTAHPQLLLSTDYKSVKMGEVYRHLPSNPFRFDEWPFVLGSEGFTEGRHSWEVIVGTDEAWGIGVARNSANRIGDLDFSPEGGFWAVGKWEGKYTAYNPPFYTSLTMTKEPKKIRIYLNYIGGVVAFFDADAADPLFAYSATSFGGEIIFPLFYVFGKAQLSISP